MTLQDAMSVIDDAVPDPSQGLPEEIFLFISRINPLINVDLLIEDDALGTLLTWRDDAHYGPGWHLPGGIIRYKETAEDRIQRTAERELGAMVHFEPEPLTVMQTILPQRERGHFISLLYRCRLRTAPTEALRAPAASLRAIAPPRDGQWRWFTHSPENIIPEHARYARFFDPGKEV